MKKIIITFFTLLVLIIVPSAFAQLQSESNEVRTRVGNPPEGTAGCWPTSGYISQGPSGSASHAGVQSRGGGPAIDIASSTGTPLYASTNGTVKVFDCTGKGVCDAGYGNLVKLVPDSSPNALIYYAHMSVISVNDGQKVTTGQQLGLMGATGNVTGPHLHYEFRGINLEPPNIPQLVTPLTCNGFDCVPSQVTSSCTSLLINQKLKTLAFVELKS